MSKDGLLCWKCRKVVPYSVNYRKRIRTICGKEFEYQEGFGTCDICHEEITVPGLDDENERVMDLIYRSKNELITVDEINEILKKYNIEKRPLSHVLEMGEHTVSRYVEGAMPSRRYSDLLRNVLAYHTLMREYLNKNKGSITELAYQKADSAISEIERLCSYGSKIELMALYIIHKAYEVTDLFLQKILYYVKAFSWILLNRDIIEENCEAWAYGPVFPKIYEKYKGLGSNIISDYNKSMNYDELLSEEERTVLDYVIDHFGIYNGSVLMRLTHKEKPWIAARNGLPEFAPSSNVIKEDDIHEYFTDMNARFNLKTSDGVNAYIMDLGVIRK